MRIEHLKYLLTVAQLQSINKASKKLCISQQQLSKIVRQLEDVFGTTIFLRDSTGSVLTADGEKIIAHISAMITELEELIAHCSKDASAEGPSHDLYFHSLSCISMERTMTLIDTFSNQYPTFLLHFDERPTKEIIDTLLENPQHIGLHIRFHDLPHLNTVLPDELAFFPTFTSSFGVYVANKHPFAKTQQNLSLHQLKKTPVLAYNPHPPTNTLADDLLQSAGLVSNVSSISNLNAFFALLQKGNHAAVGLREFRRLLEKSHASLTYLPLREKTTVTGGFIMHKQSENDPFMMTFIKFYQKNFSTI